MLFVKYFDRTHLNLSGIYQNTLSSSLRCLSCTCSVNAINDRIIDEVLLSSKKQGSVSLHRQFSIF